MMRLYRIINSLADNSQDLVWERLNRLLANINASSQLQCKVIHGPGSFSDHSPIVCIAEDKMTCLSSAMRISTQLRLFTMRYIALKCALVRRNDILHDEDHLNPNKVLKVVQQKVKEHASLFVPKILDSPAEKVALEILGFSPSRPPVKKIQWITWKPPTANCCKLNFDANFREGAAKLGGLIRDSVGNPIVLFYCPAVVYSVCHAEALALLYGINLATKLKITLNCAEGDNLLLIHSLNGVSCGDWRANSTFLQIIDIAGNIQFSHIYREGNAIADSLTRMGDKEVCYTQLVDVMGDKAPNLLPGYIKGMIRTERNGIPYSRKQKYAGGNLF